MKVGLIKYDKDRSIFEQRFVDILTHNDIPFKDVDIAIPDQLLENNAFSHVVSRLPLSDDYHMIAPLLTQLWQFHLGIHVFPNWNTSWHFDDKIKQYFLCKAHALPYTESWVFWNRQAALSWAENTATYPIVFKLKGGAGSSNVVLVKEKGEAKKLIKTMFGKGIRQWHIPSSNNVWFLPSSFIETIKWNILNLMRRYRGKDPMEGYLPHKNYVLFQKFLPGNEFDTRVTIIGDRAFAFRRMNRKNDFRSSGSGKIDYDQSKIDKRCIDIAFGVSSELHFQSMAYDFLQNESGGVEFCEMSYAYDDRAIYNCPGYWAREGNFIEGHLWPQTCILEDLLHRPIKQP